MAVPSSMTPFMAISHFTALSMLSTTAWSIVRGHWVKLSPAKIVSPILSFFLLFTKFAATSFAASMRLGRKSIASILVDTSVASMISIPSMLLSSQLSVDCGRASTIIIMERAITLKTKGACTKRFLKLMVSFVNGNVDETFIEGSIFLPLSRNHTT